MHFIYQTNRLRTMKVDPTYLGGLANNAQRIRKGRYEFTFTMVRLYVNYFLPVLFLRGWGNKVYKILIVEIYILLIYYNLLEYVFTKHPTLI